MDQATATVSRTRTAKQPHKPAEPVDVFSLPPGADVRTVAHVVLAELQLLADTVDACTGALVQRIAEAQAAVCRFLADGATYTLSVDERLLPAELSAITYTCMPLAAIGRDVRPGDIVDATRGRWGFVGTVLQDEHGLTVKPNGVEALPLQDVQVHGLVLHEEHVRAV